MTYQFKAMTLEDDYPLYGVYRHYQSGGYYEFLGLGKNSEDESIMVIYRSCIDGRIWLRPEEMFFSQVELENGDFVRRFEKLKGFYPNFYVGWVFPTYQKPTLWNRFKNWLLN